MWQRDFNEATLVDDCCLDLGQFTPERSERQAFERRLEEFVAADPFLSQVVKLDGDLLCFESESYLPATLSAHKPNLVLVVGNPAPESVALRAMYAYEGTRTRQHRFWKVMHTTGVLRFSDAGPDYLTPDEKMVRLFSGTYESPFNIHIVPFFSMPSPPGGPWGGVAGLLRLFGKQFQRIAQMEQASLRAMLQSKLRPGDSVVVLQKDAYEAIRPNHAPRYDSAHLRTAALVGQYNEAGVSLLCIPPTRLLYSNVTRSVLCNLVASTSNEVT
jgi:hypothetical protein